VIDLQHTPQILWHASSAFQSSNGVVEAGPCVVLIVETVAPAVLPPEEALRIAFGLTPSEAHVVGAIADGARLTDVADAQGIAIATARNHPKSIFAKM
jgi:DNA-binding NarL/FixJ family response regulator